MGGSKKRKIGLFGGSFDPPHKGHLKISKIAIRKLHLDELYWIITKKNPLKNKTFFLLSERIKRSKLLTAKTKKIKVKYLEDKIKSNNSVDLIKYLNKKNKKTEFLLIIGSDNLVNFHRWKRWKLLTNLVKIVVFSRKGYDKNAKKSVINKHVKNIIFIKNKLINISSTKIRKKLI
ncbi:MAG: nicotinate (nicotinamide) nucleotide adenylyltransferase [Pelagibacteraceae bacterium]|jgi:nicotinate-nucleotide adenylyltransferase|nr:nicotinate (nicotinamide) nucleotide adenylyltransferase [Pelagibacteraceae bacterium]